MLTYLGLHLMQQKERKETVKRGRLGNQGSWTVDSKRYENDYRRLHLLFITITSFILLLLLLFFASSFSFFLLLSFFFFFVLSFFLSYYSSSLLFSVLWCSLLHWKLSPYFLYIPIFISFIIRLFKFKLAKVEVEDLNRDLSLGVIAEAKDSLGIGIAYKKNHRKIANHIIINHDLSYYIILWYIKK